MSRGAPSPGASPAGAPTGPGADAAAVAASPAYSKDYWDLVLDQLRRRPSVKLATAFLVLIYATAIYAPFLANDRPLVFRGTDESAYRGAWRVIGNAAQDLVRKAEGGRAGYETWVASQAVKAAGLSGDSLATWQAQQPADFGAWLDLERGALEQRGALMEAQLAGEHHALLRTLRESAGQVRDAALAGDAPALAAASQALLGAAQAIKDSLRVAAAGEAPEPGRSVALVPVTTYPVLEALGRVELYFMGLWALVMAWPLWNGAWNRWVLGGEREAIRASRRRKLAVLLVLPLALVLAKELAFGAADRGIQTVSLKEALHEGQAQAVSVVFPPVAYGIAEQHNAEPFRPPTWAPSAVMDEEGFLAGEQRFDERGLPVHRTPVEVRAGEPALNAASRHVLGTDALGRDILARMLWGGRISLSVGLISTVLLVLIGTLLGALGGYFGGWVDSLINRVVEVFQSFPVFFLILIVVSLTGPSVLNIMLALGIFRWTGVSRLVRAEFIRLRSLDFVVASQALGARSLRTIFRHVLPNALGPVLVAATFSVATGILTESALSYLGFGVQLPIPSWGSLLNESRNPDYWWIQVFPGLAVFVTVILYNLVGEGVRDALDPRLKEG